LVDAAQLLGGGGFEQVTVLEQEYKRQKTLKRQMEKKKKEKLILKSKELAKRVKELEEQNAQVEEMMKKFNTSLPLSPTQASTKSSKVRSGIRNG